ncbi:hypothetical protein ABZ402_47765, partial [Streptomyces mirabilis]|uniref:hypothetical protein n=1 Tax=Streptomyces mirabilis TaxID=68239 RepID=UPI0033DE97CA
MPLEVQLNLDEEAAFASAGGVSLLGAGAMVRTARQLRGRVVSRSVVRAGAYMRALEAVVFSILSGGGRTRIPGRVILSWPEHED